MNLMTLFTIQFVCYSGAYFFTSNPLIGMGSGLLGGVIYVMYTEKSNEIG